MCGQVSAHSTLLFFICLNSVNLLKFKIEISQLKPLNCRLHSIKSVTLKRPNKKILSYINPCQNKGRLKPNLILLFCAMFYAKKEAV